MTLFLLFFHLAYAAVLSVFKYGFYRARSLNRVYRPIESSKPKVTVLVPFRDEEANLPGLLQDLLKQDYPPHLLDFICIDDHSKDRSSEIVASTGNRIRLIRLSDTTMGKKAALEAGVAQSQADWILTTDADCRLPEGWASSLVREGQESVACMVCGTVAIGPSTGILGVFQVLETRLLQRMGAASLTMGFPLLNTGASLAFRRETFLEVGGYSANSHLASGDDTFLMLAMHALHPGRVVCSTMPDAQVTTAAEPDWKTFFHQRHRRASKIRHYRSPYIVLVGAVLFLGQSATLAALVLFLTGYLSSHFLMLFLALRFLPEFLLIGSLRPFRFLFALIPVSLVFPLLSLPAILPAGTGLQTWKGRPIVNKKQGPESLF